MFQAIDAATKEQAEQQPTIQQEDEDAEQLKEDEEVPMEIDEDDIQVIKGTIERNKTTYNFSLRSSCLSQFSYIF